MTMTPPAPPRGRRRSRRRAAGLGLAGPVVFGVRVVDGSDQTAETAREERRCRGEDRPPAGVDVSTQATPAAWWTLWGSWQSRSQRISRPRWRRVAGHVT